jgi:tetratricopeptide (TPR) repeat protein
MPMPSIALGVRHERAGELSQALRIYTLAAQADEPDAQAEALRRQADVHRAMGAWDESQACLAESRRVANRARLPLRMAEALNAEGILHSVRGDSELAGTCWQGALAMATDPTMRGMLTSNLGVLEAQRGNTESAARFFEESVRFYEVAHFPRGIIMALINLGCVTMDAGRAAEALPIFTRAIGACDAAGTASETQLRALAQLNRAECRILLGDAELTGALLDMGAATIQFRSNRDRYHAMECFRVWAQFFEAMGDPGRAEHYLKRARAVAQSHGLEAKLEDQVGRSHTRREMIHGASIPNRRRS